MSNILNFIAGAAVATLARRALNPSADRLQETFSKRIKLDADGDPIYHGRKVVLAYFTENKVGDIMVAGAPDAVVFAAGKKVSLVDIMLVLRLIKNHPKLTIVISHAVNLFTLRVCEYDRHDVDCATKIRSYIKDADAFISSDDTKPTLKYLDQGELKIVRLMYVLFHKEETVSGMEEILEHMKRVNIYVDQRKVVSVVMYITYLDLQYWLEYMDMAITLLSDMYQTEIEYYMGLLNDITMEASNDLPLIRVVYRRASA